MYGSPSIAGNPDEANHVSASTSASGIISLLKEELDQKDRSTEKVKIDGENNHSTGDKETMGEHQANPKDICNAVMNQICMFLEDDEEGNMEPDKPFNPRSNIAINLQLMIDGEDRGNTPSL